MFAIKIPKTKHIFFNLDTRHTKSQSLYQFHTLNDLLNTLFHLAPQRRRMPEEKTAFVGVTSLPCAEKWLWRENLQIEKTRKRWRLRAKYK